ncbi:MAG TPA: hypothetical protein VF510_03850, partial [Ktedonobacterales bacterium]
LDDLLSASVPAASAQARVAITPARGITWRLDDLRQRARDALSGQSFISLPPVPPMSGTRAPRKPISTPASSLPLSGHPQDDTGHTVQH